MNTEYIEGNVSVSGDIQIANDAHINGTAVVRGDLRVDGWLDVENIRGAGKGVFTNAEELKRTHPDPLTGDWAWVGNTFPATLYRAYGGEWLSQGTTSSPSVVMKNDSTLVWLTGKVDTLTANLATLTADVKAYKGSTNATLGDYYADIEQNAEDIATLKGYKSTIDQAYSMASFASNEISKTDGIKQSLSSLKNTVDGEYRSRIASAEKNIVTLNGKVAALEARSTTVSGSTQLPIGIESRISVIEGQTSTYDVALNGDGADNVGLVENMRLVKSDILGLQTITTNHEEKIAQLDTETNEWMNSAIQMYDEVRQNTRNISQVRSQISSIGAEISGVKTESRQHINNFAPLVNGIMKQLSKLATTMGSTTTPTDIDLLENIWIELQALKARVDGMTSTTTASNDLNG